MVRWRASRTPWKWSRAIFAAERDLMLRLVESVPASARQQRVLIKRLAGMEDSSRYWSLLMVADHLRIVNEQITSVITLLKAGRVPTRVASTAAVKPSPGVTEGVMAEFESACHHLEAVASRDGLKTKARYAHPWFGPLTAAGWHFMAAFHMRLHRRQMEAIIAGLPPVPADRNP